MYRIVQKTKLWMSISIILFLVFGAALLVWGLKFGIDFTGGSLLEVRFAATRPAVSEIQKALEPSQLSSLVIQPVGNNDLIVKFQETEEAKHQSAIENLEALAGEQDGKSNLEELRFESVGPSVGAELKRKAFNAIFFVFVAIVLYITYAFRKVSKPVASWKYGVSALLAMFHDAVITMGIFAVLGKFYGTEINSAFVAAILTVIGYSVHDTIVVFDRTRENLPKSHDDFEGTVNISLNQTLIRSLNTSLTSILTLLAVLVFGGDSIRTFALALCVGITMGTYSSIFVASPMLVLWEKWQNRKAAA